MKHCKSHKKAAALHLQTHSGRTVRPFCHLFTSDKSNTKKLSKLFYCQIKKTKCKRRTKNATKTAESAVSLHLAFLCNSDILKSRMTRRTRQILQKKKKRKENENESEKMGFKNFEHLPYTDSYKLHWSIAFANRLWQG